MSDDTSSMDSFQSVPTDQEITRRVSLWKSQRDELAISVSPSMDYKRLSWYILVGIGDRAHNADLMFKKELAVAQRVLQWLDDHPGQSYYRDYIQEIPYVDFMQLEITSTLHFNLWRVTDASLWISTRDASNYQDMLWQMAVVRLSCYLNTGDWTPPRPSPIHA
jgi:hypothetical protein